MSDNEMLSKLQRDTFNYFLQESNLTNGLVVDSTQQKSPASVAAVGLALAAYTVGVERGFLTRAEAIKRTLATLRFFWHSPQGTNADDTGYKGFYYHFLDMKSGRRAWESELSTIDSAFFLAGCLAAAAYFGEDTAEEHEIRELAEGLYRRADWQWALNGGQTVSHGWRPERDFLEWRWQGYNEALLLYILGLGSPTHPLPAESYRAWTATYEWKTIYNYDFLYAGPLFIHQLSHVWLDLRHIQDDFMAGKGIDYFENSRRATCVQQEYASRNPRGFKGYSKQSWGLTAGAGPGPATKKVAGVEREFFGYIARAVPDGPDDGTLSPWAVAASLPFAPEVVLPTIHHFNEAYPDITSKYGFKCSFNPTFPANGRNGGWVSGGYYGIDQGPIVLMIENYHSEQLWRLMRQSPFIVAGLRRAGFRHGWLEATGNQQ